MGAIMAFFSKIEKSSPAATTCAGAILPARANQLSTYISILQIILKRIFWLVQKQNQVIDDKIPFHVVYKSWGFPK